MTHNSINDYSKAKQWLAEADHVLVGAGAGLSTAAGIQYSGPAFEQAFADFISRYGITDLYSSSFYPFQTAEENWACWSRHIDFVRFQPPAMPLYKQLMECLQGKDYFVITTNVDGQFRKAGCADDRLFEVQGDYAYIQGRTGSDGHTYYAENLIQEMVAQQHDCRIPTNLIPSLRQFNPDAAKDEPMEVHVRKDMYFVEDEQWQQMQSNYADWLEDALLGERSSSSANSLLLLELGVGYNTPTIIRFPFERMAAKYRNVRLIRINKEYPQAQLPELTDNFIGLTDIKRLFE